MGKKRRRRSFSPEFKAEAIRVVRESGKSVSTVARERGGLGVLAGRELGPR